MKALIASLVLAACGGELSPIMDIDGNPGDAPPACTTGITYMVMPLFASPTTTIRAVAHVDGSTAFHQYTWFLSINGGPNMTPAPATPENSEVEFPATMDAIYKVRFRVDDPNCDEAREDIDVNAPGTGQIAMRVRVVPPPSFTDPRASFDGTRIVEGGANDVIDPVQLAPATGLGGTVQLGGTGVEAYLQFRPPSPDATVEAFSSATGGFQIAARDDVSYSVLVVPTSQAIPPQVVSWSAQQTLDLDPGISIAGFVRDSANTGIAMARVQLAIDGLSSTTATTDSSGAFTVHAMPPHTGSLVHLEVTPLATSGLPRLIAESTTLDATMPVTAKYAAIVTRDLQGTVIQRGAALPDAQVTIVGTLASAGTVTAGAAVAATGETRQTATTNGSGVLPSLRVPATTLSAVIFPGAAGDHALTPIDLTTAIPATISAAATIAKTTQLQSQAGTPLDGAVVDAVPRGDLALAGAPTIRVTANATGTLSFGLAPNGTYDLRFSDPNGNHAALLIVGNASTATVIGPSTKLSPATHVTGLVSGVAPVAGAIVQFMCSQCTGLEHDRPIAEGLTGVDGRFSLAVPDPN